MDTPISKLLSIASPAIGAPWEHKDVLKDCGELGQELAKLLETKNGFFAYESALLVRPLRNIDNPLGLCEWNAPDLWKTSYAKKIDAFCFAEDVFGVQFCISDDTICIFDPETSVLDHLCDSISDWARIVIDEPNLRTGYPLAHAWQIARGPLRPGERLLPKTPFVLGGKFEVENLYCSKDIKGMLFRASVANQIRDLPDGTQVTLKARGDQT